MAVRSLALLLAALVLSLPLASANVVLREKSPVVLAMTPQLHCDIVFDKAGPETCRVDGETALVTHVRVRIAGAAFAVGYVDKTLPTGIRVQLAAFNCSQSCNVRLSQPTEGPMTIFLNPPTRGAVGSAISAGLESQPISGPV